MTENDKLIQMLNHSELFQAYATAFNEATGMPLTLRPLETWQLALHGKSKESPFCAQMSEESATCAACLQMQDQLVQKALDAPATMTCIYGLCETAAPVKVGPNTIGFLQTGQVLRRKPTLASFRRAVAAAKMLGVNLNNTQSQRAYFGTTIMSQKKLDSVSNLLAIFAEHLSIKSSQLAMQMATEEPPVITRAKQFIREHYQEDLSLSQVATAMNMSVFYFCKQFRKGAGLNFTDFVSRTRVEKAKDLLLNPHLRVSEIAYEIGFQSLTHFNRMFQKIEGQSPTKYRERLTVAVTPAGV